MTTKHSIPISSHFEKHHHHHHHDWNTLPTLLLLDECIPSNKVIDTQPHKQISFTPYPTSSPKKLIKQSTSPQSTHHTISSPKQSTSPPSTHKISSPKQSTFSRQTSQSQPHPHPPSPPSRSRTHTQQTSQSSSQSKPSSPTSHQSSTLHFLSTHHIAPYTTPSCSIALTPFQPCGLSEAVEAACLQFPSLHDIMHTQPNHSIHPSLLPIALHSQSTPTRYRLHPTHRKTPSLPNLSNQQQSMEPLPISSMWETPQYEQIMS